LTYFKREGALLMALITVLIVGAGAFALSGVSLSIGYLFLLIFIALVLAFVATYLTYHYKLTQARKTMAQCQDPEPNFLHGFHHSYLERSWNDAVIYVPPASATPLPQAMGPFTSYNAPRTAPAIPTQALTRP
ncbi:hypothetical protein BG004_006463, partial [Podila humilis]